MKITDALLGEHGVFYAQFNACERTLPTAGLECVQREAALIASALAPHATLEDELLFDALLQYQSGDNIFQVMEEEHAEIEAYLQQIPHTSDVERARALLLDAIFAARDHFAREERIAFPLAERLLGTEELLRLGARWAEARGVHEEVAVAG